MELVESMRQSDTSAAATKKLAVLAADVKEDRFKKDEVGAKQKVEAALKIDMADAAIDAFLKSSESDMKAVLERIEAALHSSRSNRSDDDNLKRGMNSKVTFQDAAESRFKSVMSSEDRYTAARLNERFRRIHAKRKLTRFDSGSAVDVSTAIYNRVNGTNEPCFLDEATGRGFQMMILIDQSGSMRGAPFLQAARASRILRRALHAPNITFDVWGFNGNAGTTIIRMPSNKDIGESYDAYCTGNTPMAQAMHVAVNYLSRGTQKKHLLVLTDGLPNAVKDGEFGRKVNAIEAVGNEAKRARKMGIHVTAIAIGAGVTREVLTQMFGHNRYWSQAFQPKQLPARMVQAVTTSFSSFLKQS
jgi:Mg-chelatase subunit ChlD